MNFDGASKGNLGISGVGCLIRDESGGLVMERSFPLVPGSCNEAEVQTLLEGLKMIVYLGCEELEIERDSRLLLILQNVEEVRDIALFYIKSQHRVNIVEALEDFGRGYPLPAAVREGLVLAEAQLIIVEFLARNTVLMRFTSNVHSMCVEGLREGHHLEKLDLPGLLASVVPKSAGVVGLRCQLGSTFSFLMQLARAGVSLGGKKTSAGNCSSKLA
ncbi:hypothetical protein KI387_009038 [Taxus chinensis]|uniref:RNase H type-1 domain-containing protein n=1 Tax=Taxus chinensis TaxID=29808 RepID=A0AA38CWN5_TAXCH|nr:hypothetical protein KI387_009038 [Taxus chinensis]